MRETVANGVRAETQEPDWIDLNSLDGFEVQVDAKSGVARHRARVGLGDAVQEWVIGLPPRHTARGSICVSNQSPAAGDADGFAALNWTPLAPAQGWPEVDTTHGCEIEFDLTFGSARHRGLSSTGEPAGDWTSGLPPRR